MVREDVLVRFHVIDRESWQGGLTIGFTGYGSMDSRHHIGLVQIGHQLGDAFEAPVLLVKTAWEKVFIKIFDHLVRVVRLVTTTPRCLRKSMSSC